MVDASLTNVSSAKDLAGKNLGVTDIGSGTHVLTQAILGSAGVDPTGAHYVAVGAGDTFIAAIQQKKIVAGMTTFPTISRLVNSGKGKILVSLLSPADTRAALGGDDGGQLIGVLMLNRSVWALLPALLVLSAPMVAKSWR